MECPKCHFDHPQQVDECLKCGVIFSKYRAFQDAVAAVRDVTPQPSPDEIAAEQSRANHEFQNRVFAMPGALIIGWLINKAMPTLTAFLEMWLHEAGHAITAWLCGYPAIPTAWFTPIFPRARWISILIGAGVAFGVYVAIRRQRWLWVAVSAAVMVLLVAGNLQHDYKFQVLDRFWGEGGAYVLATILMLTIYARPDSGIAKNHVRWALLLLGSMAFWNVYSRWSGGFQNIANFLADTDERGPSDMRVLTVIDGWPIYVLIHRYWAVGHACLIALAGGYAGGLAQAQRMKAAVAAKVRLAAHA